MAAVPPEANFEPLMTLYLTDDTSPEDIQEAKAAGIVAYKLYPAGATTNSQSGVTDLEKCMPALQAMQEARSTHTPNLEGTGPPPSVLPMSALTGP